MKWEYLVLVVEDHTMTTLGDIATTLGDKGNEGWELVSLWHARNGYVEIVMKRPKA